VARKVKRSAIDARTTRHATYAISQRKRKLIEEAVSIRPRPQGRRVALRRLGLVAEPLSSSTAAAR